MKKVIFILPLILFFTGCAAPLSKKTCNSLQGVSRRIMDDRQTGTSKEEAIAKLELFTSGKPDSKHFYQVASQIIEEAYREPLGTSESEKTELTNSFVSHVNDQCLSGEISPSYNPVIRIAPVIQ